MLIKLAKYKMKDLQKYRTELTEAEYKEAFKRKAVWHHGPNGEETCAIWKSQDVNRSIKEAGKHKPMKPQFVYVTNTHRAMAVSRTLSGIIKKFKFIQETS